MTENNRMDQVDETKKDIVVFSIFFSSSLESELSTTIDIAKPPIEANYTMNKTKNPQDYFDMLHQLKDVDGNPLLSAKNIEYH
jgi:hypothetical protein